MPNAQSSSVLSPTVFDLSLSLGNTCTRKVECRNDKSVVRMKHVAWSLKMFESKCCRIFLVFFYAFKIIRARAYSCVHESNFSVDPSN